MLFVAVSLCPRAISGLPTVVVVVVFCHWCDLTGVGQNSIAWHAAPVFCGSDSFQRPSRRVEVTLSCEESVTFNQFLFVCFIA